MPLLNRFFGIGIGFLVNAVNNNVELMVAENIGQVTVNYVSNIYKYYVAYKLALEHPH